MKLVLFDIDGTLLWTDGAGRRAIHGALLAEAGTAGPIVTYRFDGKTDPQIVRELLTLAGHRDAEDEARIQAVCRRYLGLLAAELAKPAQATRLMAGVAELLAALEPHEQAGRALVGLLTGNLEAGAALKLRSAGLDPARFRVAALGSDSHRRAALPAVAAPAAPALHRSGRRDGGLRLLIFRPADGAAAFGMLGWKGPQSQRGEYRHRAEVETRLADPDAALAILERAGFDISLRIDRTVEVYRLGEAMLRLEWDPPVDGLLAGGGARGGQPPGVVRRGGAGGAARRRSGDRGAGRPDRASRAPRADAAPPLAPPAALHAREARHRGTARVGGGALHRGARCARRRRRTGAGRHSPRPTGARRVAGRVGERPGAAPS